jgi:hypothetical protein
MQCVVVCEAALDDRNGAGMRAILPYLRTLSPQRIGSLFLFALPPYRGCPEVDYCRVPYTHRSGFRTLSLVLGTFLRIFTVFRHRSHFIILPNSIYDLMMGVVCTLATQGRRSRRTVWMMDDFIEIHAEGTGLRRWLYPKLFKYLYKSAHQRIVVSQAMNVKYQKNFALSADQILGRTLAKVLSPLNTPEWEQLRDKKNLRLVYLGSFSNAYFQPIEVLKAFLQDQVIPFSPTIEVDLFGLHAPDSKWLLPGKIQYRGSLKESDLQFALKDYDFGIIPYSFDPHTEKLMRSSFPSKLIEYLGASLPTYVIAPHTLTFLEDVRAKNIGVVQTDCTQSSLLSSLDQLLNVDRKNYQKWRENAHRWAQDEFMFDKSKINQILEHP